MQKTFLYVIIIMDCHSVAHSFLYEKRLITQKLHDLY